MALTIEHIASLAQVSRSTVSRVINDHPSVRPDVRERVLQVIREQNYAPQAAARNLASARPRRGFSGLPPLPPPEREPVFYARIWGSRQFDGVIMVSSDIDDPILPLL